MAQLWVSSDDAFVLWPSPAIKSMLTIVAAYRVIFHNLKILTVHKLEC